jgi:hypothetical protein
MAVVLKTTKVQAFGGSNPSPSAKISDYKLRSVLVEFPVQASCKPTFRRHRDILPTLVLAALNYAAPGRRVAVPVG